MPGKIVYFLVIVVLLAAWPVNLTGDSADDCTVSGKLTMNGGEAQAGALVEACLDGEVIASARTTIVGQYQIVLHKYDPAKPSIKGYRSESDLVQIKIDGHEAEPAFHPQAGALKIDLEVKTILNVKLTTWGKIKALFK